MKTALKIYGRWLGSKCLIAFKSDFKCSTIFECDRDIKSVRDLRIIGYEKGKTVVSAGSGIYKFSVIE